MNQTLCATAMVISVAFSSTANALSISTNNDAFALANMLAGSGITISNAGLIGNASQQGFFTNGEHAIGIEAGIVLTTGNALSASGPNSTSSTSTETGTGGDLNLATLTTAQTYDQNVLEFDFTTTTGNLYFSYVFASEEYNEWVNSSFNDVFGFFVNGENIALLPGTSTPVSINNVNCGNPYSGVGPNCNNFVNNETGLYNIEYDGFTTVLSASITGLDINQTHRMKLAIADVGDQVYDSAVFLKTGSFTSAPPAVPEADTYAMLLAGLGLIGFAARRRHKK